VVANWAPHISAHLMELQVPHLGAESSYDATASIDALAWPLWTFAAVVMFSFIAQSAQFEKPGRTMATIASTVLVITYIGILGSFIIQFRWLPNGAVLLAALVATAKGADVGAYTLGRLAGRHKLSPRLSPNKTVEGALGGLVFGVMASLIVFTIARYVLRIPTLTSVAAVGFGVVVGSAAQLGDLMESMIKRDCGSKDSSAIVPGYGGVLDVMDSLLFAGPVAYGYWLGFGP
jgi:phosphatidate cytidylyltransferase